MCPGGTDQQFGAGLGRPVLLDLCFHGTHVAGIAAGNGATAGVSLSGVAKGAHIIAVQVFTEITDAVTLRRTRAVSRRVLLGHHRGSRTGVRASGALNVVSVNMSLGGSIFTRRATRSRDKPAIDNLRSINVATVIAAGNDGSGTSISSPACISTAISVGSVNKANPVSSFSDVAPFLSLFAPGGSINSSVPGGGFRVLNGTSMATPHVTGTWAILRQAVPAAGVSLILDALRRTGLPITDTAPAGAGVTVPRVERVRRAAVASARLEPATHVDVGRPRPACAPARRHRSR